MKLKLYGKAWQTRRFILKRIVSPVGAVFNYGGHCSACGAMFLRSNGKERSGQPHSCSEFTEIQKLKNEMVTRLNPLSGRSDGRSHV